MNKNRIIVTSLLAVSLIAGCGSNAGTPKQPTTDTNVVTQAPSIDVTITDVIEYETGSIINIKSLITLPQDIIPKVSQYAIISSLGNVSEDYTVLEGENVVTLVVQLNDGNQWTSQFVCYGIKQSLGLPMELRDNVKSLVWSRYNFTSMIEDDIEGIKAERIDNKYSITDDIEMLDAGYALGYSLYGSSSYEKDTWGTVFIKPEEMELLSAYKANPMQHPIQSSMMSRMTESIIQLIETIEDETSEDLTINSESKEATIAYLNHVMTMLETSYTSRTERTDYRVYDESGLPYEVNKIIVTADFGTIGGGITDFVGGYYVTLKDESIIFFYPMGDKVYDYLQHMSPSKELPMIPLLETYEEFKTFLYENADNVDWESYVSSYYTTPYVDKMMERLSYNFVIGDEGILKSIIDAEDAGNTEIEVIPDATPTVTPIPTPTPIPNYKTLNPSIFEYPTNDIKYSRWIYEIDEETNYTGSIILPNGIVVNKDIIIDNKYKIYDNIPTPTPVPSNYRPSTNTSSNKPSGSTSNFPSVVPGSSSNIGSNDNGSYGGNTNAPIPTTPPKQGEYDNFTLTDSRGTIKMSTAYLADYTVNKDKSTASRVQLTNKDKEILYLQVVRLTQVNNYLTESVYSTHNFKDDNYTILSGTVDEIVVTDNGTITPYYINYVDTIGRLMKKAYMAVYENGLQYVVCYGDDMVHSMEDLVSTLRLALEE